MAADHTRANVVRAILEGVAFSLKDTLTIFKELGIPVRAIRVGGGGARSPLWRQIQADVYGQTVETVQAEEGAAYGAALLAGVGVGVWASVDAACDAVVHVAKRTAPDREASRVMQETYASYRRLYPAFGASFPYESKCTVCAFLRYGQLLQPHAPGSEVPASRRSAHVNLKSDPDGTHPGCRTSQPASLGKTVLTRRNFLWLAAGSAAGMAFYAGEISRHELEIVYRTITLPRLPDPFAGLKIVQISDFHFQEYTEASFLEAVVRRVNAADSRSRRADRRLRQLQSAAAALYRKHGLPLRRNA